MAVPNKCQIADVTDVALQNTLVLAVRRAPYPDSPVRACGGDQLPIGAKLRRQDFTGVTIVGRKYLPAGRGIPLAYGSIRRARHKAQAIRSERHAEHLASVPFTEDGHHTG